MDFLKKMATEQLENARKLLKALKRFYTFRLLWRLSRMIGS